MLKKTMWVGAGAVLLLGLLFGRDAFNIVKTGVGRMQTAVSDNVPMEFQLDRAKQMIKDLTLEYNKLRQANITKELLEISSAQMALG